MNVNTPYLVIYHGNCCDGFTAAWAANRLLDGPCELFAATYAADGEDVELPDVTGRRVYMVDFCVGAEQLHALVEAAEEIHVFDHHSENEKACGHISCCTFDMERSGAGLTWDILSGGDERPWLIDYVEDRDLWRHALWCTKEVNAYIQLVPKTIEEWDKLADFWDPYEIEKFGRGALAARSAYVEAMLPLARVMTFLGHEDIPVINAPRPHTSDLLGRLAMPSECEACGGRGDATIYVRGDGGYQLPEEDGPCPDCKGRGVRKPEFAVGWYQRSDGRYVYSLRSRGDFDVGALAQTMGGGGHPQAAGFTISAHVASLKTLLDGALANEAIDPIARRAYDAVARLNLDPQKLLETAELSPAWNDRLLDLVREARGSPGARLEFKPDPNSHWVVLTVLDANTNSILGMARNKPEALVDALEFKISLLAVMS